MGSVIRRITCNKSVVIRRNTIYKGNILKSILGDIVGVTDHSSNKTTLYNFSEKLIYDHLHFLWNFLGGGKKNYFSITLYYLRELSSLVYKNVYYYIYNLCKNRIVGSRGNTPAYYLHFFFPIHCSIGNPFINTYVSNGD